MSVQPPRGTQDILPPDSERFFEHEKRGGALFERAGYRRIITPMFEDTSVFVRGVGEGSDIVGKEMYTFTDRSDNSLTLRPEGTAPVMRAVISNHLAEQGVPVKVWYSAAMFRYDRPQKGRYRQHHQLGIEAIGTEDPAVDAEVIILGKQLLEQAGVSEFTLLLNSIGHPECRAEYMPKLVEFLEQHSAELDGDCNRRMKTNPLRVFDCKNEKDQEILKSAPTMGEFLCAECRTHFEKVQGYLRDVDVKFQLDARLVRGLDYYTRTTFEFQTPLLEAAQSTVVAGGRYDGLSESIGGPRLPGIGFGSGIERVLLAAEAAGRTEESSVLDAYIVPVTTEQQADARKLMWKLREAGFGAEIPYGDRNLKTNLKQANKLGVRFAVIIGPEDQASHQVTIRSMESGEQYHEHERAVVAWFQSALARVIYSPMTIDKERSDVTDA